MISEDAPRPSMTRRQRQAIRRSRRNRRRLATLGRAAVVALATVVGLQHRSDDTGSAASPPTTTKAVRKATTSTQAPPATLPTFGPPYNPKIVTATMNVLIAFGTGPAGTAHPSVPNWRGLAGTGG